VRRQTQPRVSLVLTQSLHKFSAYSSRSEFKVTFEVRLDGVVGAER
jgi:hypothetical protein